MSEYVRHAVSQHLGSARISITFSGGAPRAVTVIAIESAKSFTFVIERSLDELASIFSGADVADTIARIAICQAHNSTGCGILERFDIGLRPWKGDLCTSEDRKDMACDDQSKPQPSRSTQTRIKRTMRHLAEEYTADKAGKGPVHSQALRCDRRVNRELSEIVDQAVRSRQEGSEAGQTAAVPEHAVPLHIQLRIFSCAAFRRKS